MTSIVQARELTNEDSEVLSLDAVHDVLLNLLVVILILIEDV